MFNSFKNWLWNKFIYSNWAERQYQLMSSIDPYNFTPEQLKGILCMSVYAARIVCEAGVMQGKFIKNKLGNYSLPEKE